MTIENLDQLDRKLQDAISTMQTLEKVTKATGDELNNTASEKALSNLKELIDLTSIIANNFKKLGDASKELQSQVLRNLEISLTKQTEHAKGTVYPTTPAAVSGKTGGQQFYNAATLQATAKQQESLIYAQSLQGNPTAQSLATSAASKGVNLTREATQKRIIALATEIDTAIVSGVEYGKTRLSIGGVKINVKKVIEDSVSARLDNIVSQIDQGIVTSVEQEKFRTPPPITAPETSTVSTMSSKEAIRRARIELGQTFRSAELPTEDRTRYLEQFRQSTEGVNDVERIRAAFEDINNLAIALGKNLRDAAATERRLTDEAKQTAKAQGEAARRDTKGLRGEELILQERINAALDKEIQRRQKAGILTENQVKSLRDQDRYSSTFANIDRQAAQYGVQPHQVEIEAKEFGTTGITQVKSQFRNTSGELVGLTQTVDRFGRTLEETSRRNRSWGAALRANARDFLQWTLIAGSFYTVFQKITEITGLAISNQEKLADITIALGKAQSDTNKIFEDAYSVSKLTGEGINGVLEGYSLAYRVTSEYTDATERAAVTNKLMVDSLTLSKLSTLSQAEALDVLVAGLEQSNQTLDQGSTMLDKWVAISKQSNVDLASLAQSYAIVGKSAENAGLSMEGVAALSSALAKSGIASGKELGNQLRTIISGFQSAGAEKVLNKYGIAIKDMNGELRSTDTLLKDVATRAKSGEISPTALSEITLAVGGGARGQQRVAAAIESYMAELDKINTLMKSGDFVGSAQAALDIKLETVATAVEKLSNAFQKLAQTIGTKNGLLDVTKGLVDLLTKAIGAIDKLAGLAGSSFLPSVGAIALTAYAGRGGGKNGLTDMASKINTFAYGAMNPMQRGIGPSMTDMPYMVPPVDNASKGFIGNNYFGLLGGGLTVAAQSGSSLMQGQNDKAAAQGIGGLLGLAAGSALTGVLGPFGPILGAQIGTAAGEGVINFLDENRGRLAEAVRAAATTVGYYDEGTEPSASMPEEDKQKILSDYLAGITNAVSGTGNLSLAVRNAIGFDYTAEAKTDKDTNELLAKTLNKYLGVAIPAGAKPSISQSKLEEGFTELERAVFDIARIRGELGNEYFIGAGGYPTAVQPGATNEEALVFAGYGKDAAKAVADALSTQVPEFKKLQGQLYPEEDTAAYKKEQEKVVLENFLPYINEQVRIEGDISRSQLAQDKIGLSEFNRQQAGLAGVRGGLLNFMEMLYPEQYQTGKLTTETEGITDEYIKFRKYATEEENIALNSYLATYADAETKITEGLYTEAQARDVQAEALANANLLLQEFGKNLAQSVSEFPRLDYKDYTKPEFTSLYKYAYGQKETELRKEAEFSPTDQRDEQWVQSILNKTQEYLVDLESGADVDTYSPAVIELLGSILDEAAKQTGIMNKQGLGLNIFDQYSPDVIAQAAAASRRINTAYEEATGGDYEGSVEEFIGVTSDGLIQEHADMKIMQYLLGKIEENTSKQLEGLYNMPEGASFYFPSSAIPLIKAAGQGGGGQNLAGLQLAIENLLRGLENLYKTGGTTGASILPAGTTISTVGPVANGNVYAGMLENEKEGQQVDYGSGSLPFWMNKAFSQTTGGGFGFGANTSLATGNDLQSILQKYPWAVGFGGGGATPTDDTESKKTSDSDGSVTKLTPLMTEEEKQKQIMDAYNARRATSVPVAIEPEQPQTPQPNLWDSFVSKSKDLFGFALSAFQTDKLPAQTTALPEAGKMNTAPTLGLNLDITSNTTINLDGRQIWNAVKVYARQDLLTYSGTSGSATQNIAVTV